MEYARKGAFDPEMYRWGMTVPTWSLPKDPLSRECLSKFEMYQGEGCFNEDSSKVVNKWNWDRIKADFNYASRNSSSCLIGYDLLGSNERRNDI